MIPTRGSRRRRRPPREGRRRRAWWSATWVTTSLLSLVVALPLLAFLATVWARGWTIQAVLSSSMEPGIPSGSVVVIAPVDAASLQPGAVVSFTDPADRDVVYTHRITGRLEQPTGLFFTTQGDNNPSPDAQPVPARSVRGTVRWRVLGLGRVVEELQHGNTARALVAAPIGILIASEVVGVALGRRHRRALAEIARQRTVPRTDLAGTGCASGDGLLSP